MTNFPGSSVPRALLLVVVLGGCLMTDPARAGADLPTDPTPVCRGTTEDGTGATTTPTSGSIVLAGAYLYQYQAGEPVSMYNNLGERAFTNGGAPAVADRVPSCAVRRIDGVPVATWLYCTDETLSACNSSPTMTDEQPNPRLSQADQQQIAVILRTAAGGSQELTSRGRAIVQLQVWCISEGTAPGSEMTAARSYFNSNNRLPPGQDITTPEAVCDPRPSVPSDPTVTVDAVTAGPTVGTPAQYDVVSSTTGPVDLIATSGTVSLCPSDVSGATISDNRMTVVAAGVAVRVCVSTPTAGTQTLAGQIDYSSVDGLWTWLGGATCQYFAGYRGRIDSVSDSAAVTVVPAPTSTTTSTTTTTTASASTTTTTAVPLARAVPRALAATGGHNPLGPLLVAVGVASLGVGVLRLRRPVRQTGR